MSGAQQDTQRPGRRGSQGPAASTTPPCAATRLQMNSRNYPATLGPASWAAPVALGIIDQIREGPNAPLHRASIAGMVAACVASAGVGLFRGRAATMTMDPIVPEDVRYLGLGRDPALSSSRTSRPMPVPMPVPDRIPGLLRDAG